MNTKVQRWGNSLAVRLPRALATRAGVTEGSPVVIEEQGKLLIVRPVRRYRLDDLLSRVRAATFHGEISTGPRRGRESW